MRVKLLLALVGLMGLLSFQNVLAQDLGSKFKKVKDGIYVYQTP